MINDIAILLLFAALNVAALFYRRGFTPAAAVYLATLMLLYAAYLFLGALTTTSMVAYFITSAYLIFKEKRLLILVFTFANYIICDSVIPREAGWAGGLTLAMFFNPDPDPRLLNTIDATAGMSLFFMCSVVPIFLLMQLLFYLFRKLEGKQ